MGVQRALVRLLTVPISTGTYAYGRAFEHFVILEILRLSSYLRNDFAFSYLKFTEQMEIDLIIERPGKSTILLEIKSARSVIEQDLKALIHYRKDFNNAETFCLSQDTLTKEVNGVLCLPWREGIDRILNG